MDSSTVVASVKYAIDHNETVHLTHAESDGSTAVLLVDPIRLGGGSLTAYDHHAEQVRTLAVSRISGVVAIQISA
jgi:predicted DNA-binding transcriptional regulator YafY